MLRRIVVSLPSTSLRSYTITIGIGLRQTAGTVVERLPASQYFVVTDANVHRLYGRDFLRRLQNAGAKASLIVVPAGERSKSRAQKEKIENAMLKRNADRETLIVALGGGMVGDLAGFAASTLHRGIRYIHIPTTLLAQVDSSIGGKVAINHPSGKNLLGAFHQPAAVYIDLKTIRTLPDDIYTDGLAEIVKYGAILDPDLFTMLERSTRRVLNRHLPTLSRIIARCCELKQRVVERDERESSYRRILNFGHTIGHAIELASHYRVSHGRAVAIGMTNEARMSRADGRLSAHGLERLTCLLQAFGLPTELPPNYRVSDIVRLTRSDKKRHAGGVRYTLLGGIGRGIVDVQLTERDVRSLLSR